MAILEALKKWCQYFLGNKLLIKTDQSSLKYIASQRLLEGIQHKLMLKLLEFDFTIDYKKGSENVAADALSRQFQQDDEGDQDIEEPATCLATTTAIPTWALDITASYSDDNHCKQLLQALAVAPDSHPNFSTQSGILRYKGRIYIYWKLFHPEEPNI